MRGGGAIHPDLVSVREVLGIKGANIDVRRLDMLDGTPILNIKPHIDISRG